MSAARRINIEEPDRSRRLNPFAVVGVLLLVIASIAIGVLGPQISQRGNMASGVPLGELLTQVYELFREEQRAAYLNRGIQPSSIRQQTIESVIGEQLGPDEVPPDLAGLGFKPIRFDEGVRLADTPEKGIAVVYEQMGEVISGGDSQPIVLLLYLPFTGEMQSLYARDALGVPTSLETGEIYIRQIARMGGRDLWTATWRVGTILHLLVVPGEDLFDTVIDKFKLSEPKDGTGPKIAGAFPEWPFESPGFQSKMIWSSSGNKS